MFIIGRKSKL